MAGGIDWFRWHHGSVTDPKFQLIAKKTGVRLGDVLVVWTFILEGASASAERGTINAIDFETLDFLLGMEDGTAARIVDAMTQRGLIGGGRVTKWEVRQPKRERDPAPPTDGAAPMTSTERSRKRRESAKAEQAAHEASMQRDATPGNANNDQATPREEKRREDSSVPVGTDGGPPSPPRPGGLPGGPWPPENMPPPPATPPAPEPPAPRRRAPPATAEDRMKAEAWDMGKRMLAEAYADMTREDAGKFIGNLIALCGKQVKPVHDAVLSVASMPVPPVDLKQYLTATALTFAGKRLSKQDQLEADNDEAVRQALAKKPPKRNEGVIDV